jgi:hypothetical protein
VSDPLESVKKELAKLIGELGTKQLNPGNLISRIIVSTGLNSLDVQQSMLTLSNTGLITGIGPRGIPIRKVGWTDVNHHPVSESRKLMIKVAEMVSGDQSVCDILVKHHKYFCGLNEEDCIRFVASILALKETPSTNDKDRYILSARHLLGSSKVLDNISRLTKDLNITLPADESAYYVLTAGKATATQVIFVENPRAFNYLKPFAHQYDTLIISAYGYGLTLENFSGKLEKNAVIACPTDNERQADLLKILSKTCVIYWGDLDKEGLSIFESLQINIPQLRLSSIYSRMLEDVIKIGHPYHALFDKAGQKNKLYRLSISASVIDKSQDRALDQEMYCQESYLNEIFAPLIELAI